MTDDTQVYAPRTPHAWPSAEHEETVSVRRTEIKEFADEVLRIAKNPLENSSTWSATMFGIAISAALSLAAILASSAKHDVPGWIYLLHGSLLLGAGGIAVFSYWVHRKQKQASEDDAQRLATRIRACDERAPRFEGDQ